MSSDHDTRVADELAALRAALAAERAAKEQALAQLELRDRALDAVSSAIMIIEETAPSRPIVYVNRGVQLQSGYSAADLIGRNISIFDAGQPDSPQMAEVRAAIEEGRSIRLELRARRKDGSSMWSGVTVAPVHDAAGKVTHCVTVSADITERLELQERLNREREERERMALDLKLAQKLESVGRLAAGIAHEINTPIQYVGDSIYFLRDAVADLEPLLGAYREAVGQTDALDALAGEVDLTFLHEEMPKAFDRTLDGVERVATIVRAMKEFAHPDAAEQSPAEINDAIQTTLVVTRNEYKYAATVELSLGELPSVVCNIGELNQVFLNLIVNAAHAIGSAGKDAATGRIAVRTSTSGSHVVIEFEDNGCGIAAEHLEKIYDPFFTTKEVGQGSGQGLAIARSIVVERHGGTISVDSTPGIGTRFVITLPIDGLARIDEAAA